MTRSKKFLMFIIILALVFCYLKFFKHYPRNIDLKAKDDFWGVTYSPKFAKELGLDWQEAYLAILDDLEVKNIRIPIYWDQIETGPGEYDFSVYDYIFDEGAKRDVKFMANIGWRLPRWPECHAPVWHEGQNTATIKDETYKMLENVVNRYKHRSEIVSWQVENEPLLNTFGECPKGDLEFLKKEVALVKSLDDRPIIISASGELSTWRHETDLADIFGTTMYRVVWNWWFGYFRYPLPAWFYQEKAWFNDMPRDKVIVSELQAEPWVPDGTLADIAYDEYNQSFDIAQFRANLQFAINADFKQTYLWGVEWWYLQNKNNNSVYWDQAKEIFR